jgi:hypothetical protein
MAKLGDLNPNEKNPRRISESQLEGLKKSLAEFGPLDGFVFNRKTKRLIGGHQRQKSLPPKCPITILEKISKPNSSGTIARGFVETENGERIVYREVDWPEAKEKAAMVAANKHSGEWETEMLAQIFNELETNDRDLTGFAELEIAHLLQTLPKEVGENDPNAEWIGMPECENENLRADYSVLVNFETEEDKIAFGKLIDRPLAGKTRSSIWFPAREPDGSKDFHYGAE